MKKFLSVALLTLMMLSVLSGCGNKQEDTAPESDEKTQIEETQTEETKPEEGGQTEEKTEAGSEAEEEAARPDPITADQLAEGTYAITVDSSSSMFNVVHCDLIVADGSMKAVMTMSGQGYGKLFMGTGEAAAAASEEEFIPFELDADGAKTFTVPVEALNQDTDCAAWSIKKEKWYDRVLVFHSSDLPETALLG